MNRTIHQVIPDPERISHPMLRLARDAGAEEFGCWRMGDCQIFAGLEPCGLHGEMRWHLSISHPERYPSWDEIAHARYSLVPNEANMVMPLPPREEFINIHSNCFHLFQTSEGEI